MVAVLVKECLDYKLAFSQLLALMASVLQMLVHKVSLFEVIEMLPLLEN